jgi:hypothetical protein
MSQNAYIHCSTGVQAPAQAGNGSKSRKLKGSYTRRPPSGVGKALSTRSHAAIALAAASSDLMDDVTNSNQGSSRAKQLAVLSDTEDES